PINGTPGQRNSCYWEPGPELSLAKFGPAAASPGQTITFTLVLSNVGQLDATGVVLTDVLPVTLTFVAQDSDYDFSQVNQTLVWQIGNVLTTAAPIQINLTVQVAGDAPSGSVTNSATAADDTGHIATAQWQVNVVPEVRLYAVHPEALYSDDEAVAIINLSDAVQDITGWRVNDGGTYRATLPAATIQPDQIIWLTEDADAFYTAFGFEPDYALTYTAHTVPLMSGMWPGFTNKGDEVYLENDLGQVVDALAYGTGSATTGWIGPAVDHPRTDATDGDIVYRKLDQATGLPVPDTDTAADWAQDADDPINGRKARFPGWDLEEFFFPAQSATTADLTIAIAPEGSLALISETLASARSSIIVEGYTFESVPLYGVISDRLQAGVVVTMLLEGGPAGGIEDTELWIAKRIHEHARGTVYFWHNQTSDTPKVYDRYPAQHAKFIIVDGNRALISTENFGEHGFPSDPLFDGTLGHRGVILLTDSAGVVNRLKAIFARDCDPAHHNDIVEYGSYSRYTVPGGYEPPPVINWTVYSPVFTSSLQTTGSDFELVQAPETALRDRDSLLGLIGQAGADDTLLVQQLYEYHYWGETFATPADGNPRLEAYIAAARRGASVRILLDDYYDDPSAPRGNTATCLYVNTIASSEGLDLSCRLANPTGLGVHSKMVLVRVGSAHYIHVGSINGSEPSNRENREVALQARSDAAYNYLASVFEHDWALSHPPFTTFLHLPLVMRGYTPPVDYPVISEVKFKGFEWVELYNPGPTVDIGEWTIGDAVNPEDYGDRRYQFPAGTSFVSGDVVVIAISGTEFASVYGFTPDFELVDTSPAVPELVRIEFGTGEVMALGNEGDELLLLDADGAPVDVVTWGTGHYPGVVGFATVDSVYSDNSIERYPANMDSNDCNRDFRVRYTPDPGHVWE
nr:DUF11 domain-containing protein [Anaerolineae bacterium]